MNCSSCGKSIKMLGAFGGVFSPSASVTGLGSAGDFNLYEAQVCTSCGYIFCGNCIKLGRPTPCLKCGKPTEPAYAGTVGQLNIKKYGENIVRKEIKEFTDDNFEKEALSSDKLVVVDLWAPWCGPCKKMIPIMEEVAAEYGDKVTIGKLNVDDNPQTAAKYSVTSIPTLFFIKNGVIAEKQVGLLAKEPLKKKIQALLES